MNIDINIGPVSFYMEFLWMDTCLGQLKACAVCNGSGLDLQQRDCPTCDGCGSVPVDAEGDKA